LQAVSEERPHDEHLRRLWFETLAAVTERTARVIRCARRSGQAPPSADPEALAACLMWAFERIMHVALIGDAPGLPGPSLTPSLSQTPGKKPSMDARAMAGAIAAGFGRAFRAARME